MTPYIVLFDCTLPNLERLGRCTLGAQVFLDKE